ncbi:bifunctional diguanylate cyclase/phosphodiesterase [Aerolutibacter daejeonensis]|uniref:bifunctional diguanylate cyclase/phosphodiesterase n=1 Tax=Aerolutibacter daejeonensis TaxID=346181 RepID=UPI001E2BF87A|nr:EAL domain-containing protein [Lysobacter daejeonensis]
MGTSKDVDGFSTSPRSTASVPAVRPWAVTAWVWSLTALLAGILLTVAISREQQRRVDAEQRLAFDGLAQRGFEALQTQLEACGLLSRTVQTLFMTSEEVTALEFEHIYENLRPRERFPSLLALTYADRRMMPDGEHFITTRVVPLQGNERVMGLDIARQVPNLRALRRSTATDQPALSAPFTLVQTDALGGSTEGVTLRLPVFAPGVRPDTPAERRDRLRGSLAVSFRIRDLIESAIQRESRDALRVRVSDVTDGPGQMLFDSNSQHRASASAPAFDRLLRYGGRVWQVQIQPLDYRPAGLGWRESVFWPGLLASVLLALLVWSLATTRHRALQLGLRMSHQYRESEERFRALNELLPALVLLADRKDGQISYANQAARARLGRARLGQGLAALFEDPAVHEHLVAAGGDDAGTVEVALRDAEGQRFWASLSLSPAMLDEHEQWLMVATDVSEQRQLTEMLSYQASHDGLTELFNRREFERRAELVVESVVVGGPAAALFYIDLDQFKLINDTSGHIAGDQLLIQLATLMHEQLRGGDILARLGGDEFGVLACQVGDREGASLLAERIREHIDGFVFVWEQSTYTISASIGAVMIDHPGLTLKDVMAQADTACYLAKEAGRNRVHFYSEQDDETTRRRSEMEWANRLRWAIDEGRLQLQYQEVRALDPSDGGEPRVELLLRFRDEAGRLVVPGAFIPAAERYGLMPMIDRWVIENALANFDRLHPSGDGLALATINVSGASLEDESLTELILQLLQRYRVAPQRVCFEITETVAVRNLSQVSRFIERLRDAGCRIALDDFGAGMSSFGYLKNLPVDIIKIDGSFIRDLLNDPMSHAIVRAVTDIGHQRGLQVVAEWVASEEILQALVALGVDYAQGFALHQPTVVPFQAG